MINQCYLLVDSSIRAKLMVEYYNAEDGCMRINPVLAAMTQIMQFALAARAVQSISNEFASSHPILSSGISEFAFKVSVLMIPLLLFASVVKCANRSPQELHQLSWKFGIRPSRIVPKALFMMENTGKMAQTVFTVAMVAKFALGHYVEATISLAILGIGLMGRHGELPEELTVFNTPWLHTRAVFPLANTVARFVRGFCLVAAPPNANLVS